VHIFIKVFGYSGRDGDRIFIKQRHVQTFRGIIHVCQAILETGSGRKWSHNGCTAAILTTAGISALYICLVFISGAPC
jgi:hypothetical protein